MSGLPIIVKRVLIGIMFFLLIPLIFLLVIFYQIGLVAERLMSE